MLKRFCKGLRIIDLVIITGLLGLLIIVIYSRYDSFACRSMQSEAKFSLNQIHAAQVLYHKEHDRYASLDILLNLEKRIVLPQKYYYFTDAEQPTRDGFRIIAQGQENTLVAGDLWLIDEHKNIINQTKACEDN